MRNTLLKTALSIALAASASLAIGQSGGAPDYRLAAGDSIKVQVYQNPDLTLEARVSESGTVNYPLVGGVNLGGLSIAEAESRIAAALKARQILKDPQVNIVLQQVRGNQVSVLGQVQRPGRFPLETMNVRVSDMLAAAGGVSATGDDRVVVTGVRDGKPFRREVDVNAIFSGTRPQDDIVLTGGDTLYVSKAPTYYIYGEAQRPGPYRVERGMTVMQAIAAGGGVTPRGSENRLRLHRAGPDGAVTQIVPRLTDVVQPGDVLYVRESIF
ncbi:polysaccharide export protein EpsE [Caenimonas sp. SL110]|uniref:polysaccharide export protein EpsE n=1 Tax=Caenimonas sp. SL110 TaxID=1450524 RepID=UPI000653293A|nr:polysaccharide export protein EpsE [Caenimonas sp. SL110]